MTGELGVATLNQSTPFGSKPGSVCDKPARLRIMRPGAGKENDGRSDFKDDQRILGAVAGAMDGSASFAKRVLRRA